MSVIHSYFSIHKCMLFLLICLIQKSLSFDPYSSQPRIITQDGHLILFSGESRNITLRTNGRGFVNLNDENLVQIVSMAKTAAENVDRIQKTVIAEFQTTLDNTLGIINGPDGIVKRMAIIETLLQNGTTTSGGAKPSLQLFQNRINNLNRRVTQLQRQVRQLTTLLTQNECLSNPCRNGGTCLDLYNGFTCKCPPSWQGPFCDEDVNECLQFAGTDLGCQHGATCINKPGTYECQCQSGWYGLHCTQQTNDCNSVGAAELCGNGICINQKSGTRSFSCICNQGWTENPSTGACTQDVDECSGNHPSCSRNPLVQCINVPGSFYCGACPAGFSGNGFYCNDIDECLINNGGCSTNPRVQCINTLGSRVCGDCPPGYQGDGITCNYLGTCNVNNGGCHPLATCTVIGSTVRCDCPIGYTGLGVGPNGCILLSVPVTGPCTPNPCLHGICTVQPNRPSTYRCQCYPGYTGLTCNSVIDPCDSNPCQNGGTCISLAPGDYRCQCNASYTGQNCQKEQQNCGGVLNSPQGSLKFPSSTSGYAPNLSCAWVIVTNRTQVLNVTFKSFHLESSRTCKFDWLQIHDGRSSSNHLIGRFCGTDKPKGGTIISTHNALYLWFRSDKTRNGDGFELTWNATTPTCGGFFYVSTHGRLSSPGSPGNYPNNRDCEWRIQSTNLNKRIEFQFFTLQIENHPNCSFDYLEIFDGSSDSDPLLGRYCNTSHPPPIRTSGPSATVNFHSDNYGNDAGFQISYTVVEGIPGCGGVFTKPSGVISSPNHPDTYEHNMDCEWKIQLPIRERVKLVFTSFSLEPSWSCRFDYVEVRDGPDSDSPLIGKYCGTKVPASITSSQNTIFIRFRSDWVISSGGFHIKYEALCGGVFSGLTGTLLSPYYPSSYPDNKVCIYQIALPPGKAIILEFQDFAMEYTFVRQCDFDYLEIRDGDSEKSPLINKYCGGQEPPTITSTHNYLWLKFSTDSFIGNRGFKANYSAIDVTCGGIYKEKTGQILSPNSMSTYPPNTRCRWIIVADPGWVVQLSFSSFSLEENIWGSDACSYDYLAVYDNSSLPNSGGLMGKFCGTNIPPIMTTTDNVMTIEFKSDNSNHMEGFSASYMLRDVSKLCGVNYFSAMGQIMSPNYPYNYPNNKKCSWTITVPFGHQIELNFTDFELENHASCKFDYLEIRNGGYENSPLIKRYCGDKNPGIIRSSSNQLFLQFVSDFSRSRKGFKILWDGTTTGCGGTLTSMTGSIISPNYPQAYGHKAECFWRISVAKGSVIQIVIVDLELETSSKCFFDYLEFREGRDSSGKLLGRYCNVDDHPHLFRTKSNHLFIKFRSDTSRAGRGFNLRYTTICSTTVSGFHGVIESPNYPEHYPPDLDCTWNITATRGNKLNVTFSSFELEGDTPRWGYSQSDQHCIYDYVEVMEGHENDPPTHTIGRHCGSESPPYIASTMDHVYVHFVTDHLREFSGFRLEWILNGCGGHFEHPEDSFTSPGYPGHYTATTTCEWLITIDYDKSVQLLLEDFNMEHVQNCGFDSLTIYGGPDDTAPSLAQLCLTQSKPIIYTSSGNSMFLRFVSDWSFSGRGFKASYKSVPIRCGGKFTAPKGNIHSRNYPNIYDSQDDCMWFIEVDQTHVIELSFIDFDLEGGTNCTYDYLRIFDGNTTEHPLLLNHCGNTMPNKSVIRTTGNQMLVHMKTDGSRVAKGFLANYTIACGARLITEESGVLSIQESVSVHPNNSNCSWIIMGTQADDHVTLLITHLEFTMSYESGEECEHYMVNVYDGEDKEAPLIGTYCNSRSPPAIVSQGPALVVELVAPWGIPTGSFEATYSVLSSACGGNLTSLYGAFATPGYPNGYPPVSECVWIISASPGNKVHLAFRSFEIEESDHCNEDYLEIRRNDGGGPLIGVYCGNNVPSNVTDERILWIKFHSSGTGTAAGFIADYSLVHGTSLFGPSGQVASPLYPRQCLQYGEYSWRITVDFGKVISITFSDFLITTYSDECYYYLKIYDGFDDTGPLLFEACGASLPDPVVSSSNIVYITFNTGSGFMGSRFLLNWLQIERGIPTYPSPTSSPTPGCGGTFIFTPDFNVTSYNFTSPGYPNGYSNVLTCEWIIETPPEYHLQLSFKDMDLDTYAYGCYQDYVEVYSGIDGTQNWEFLKSFCMSNSTLEPFIETTNLMRVVFHTDYYGNKTGFSATVIPVCGGSLRGPSGSIDMETGTRLMEYRGGTHYRSISCQWNITVKTGRTISSTFDWINIPTTDSTGVHCPIYFVILQNGGSASSPMLGNGKYCGNSSNPLPVNETTGDRMYIRYTGTASSKGFKLKYQEVSVSCGNTIYLSKEANSTVFTSPRYPNSPDPHQECQWIVVAPGTETLQLDFIERFDFFHTSSRCDEEYVEVRDGGTQHAKQLGLYCNTKPGTLKTTGNVIYVKYFSNTINPHQGFKAKVTLEECGGVVRGQIGYVTSPGYPTSYANNLNCQWNIVGPPDHYLTINLLDLDLPSSSRCFSSDNLNITDMAQINGTGLIKVLFTSCEGFQPNNEYYTASNEAKVTFYSDNVSGYRNFKGFKVKFNASEESCGGTIDSPSGVIQSPRYPQGTSSTRVCSWKITVPRGRKVTVEFLDIDFQGILEHYWNRIWLYNDLKFSTLIGRVTQIPPNNYSSTSNKMLIYYVTDNNFGHRGFKLRFHSDLPAVCGGKLEGSVGYITQPAASLGLKSYYCEWWREGQQNETFILTLLNGTIGTQQAFSCSYSSSSLKFFLNGDDTSDSVSLCGNYTVPYILGSPYNNIRLEALQSEWHGTNNFTIKYSANSCGGIVHGPEATISSPNYPDKYPANTDCVWSVVFPEGQAIKIHFIKFTTQNDCGKDYMAIYNGPSPSHPMIKKLCGNQSPQNITSQSNKLWIVFHSDDSTEDEGFSFTVEPEIRGCGGVIHSNDWEIFTPNYPKQYSNNAECDWTIQADAGYTIQFTFIERFQIEESTQCVKDYVEGELPLFWYLPERKCKDDPLYKIALSAKCTFKLPSMTLPNCNKHILNTNTYSDDEQNVSCRRIFDYVDKSWVSIKKSCGRNTPGPVESTSNKLRVLFRSDDSNQGDGFKAVWKKRCGGIINNVDRGQIISPGYPVAYGKSLSCNYTFLYPNTYVTITFTDFLIEKAYSGVCKYDNVTIRSKFYYWNSELSDLGTYCGDDTPPTIRKNDRVEIIFKTDKYYERKGFMLTFEKDECGGNVTQPRIIKSIGSSDNGIVDRANCTWFIKAPVGQMITVSFSKFKLEYSANCNYDWIALYRGNIINQTRRLGIFCGDLNSNPPLVHTHENEAIVNWYTDSSYSNEGFEASILFTEVCGGVINMTESLQYLLRYPNSGKYEEYRDCVWKVFASVGQVIQFTITSLDLTQCLNTTITGQESKKSCECDYLEVRDGMNQYSTLIGKYCGTSPPPVLTSTSNTLYLRFVCDGMYNGNGFQVHLMAVPPICGNPYLVLNSTNPQILTSPNYPSNYPVNIRCRWILSLQSNIATYNWGGQALIYIHFEDMDIKSSDGTCTNDKLQIRDFSPWQHVSASCVVCVKPWQTQQSERSNANCEYFKHMCPNCCLVARRRGGTADLTHRSQATANGHVGAITILLREGYWEGIHGSSSMISEGLGDDFVYNGRTNPYNYIAVYTGSQNPTTTSTFCGRGHPLDYYSNTENVEVLFVSSNNATAKGFKLHYAKAGCNRNYTGVQGRIRMAPDNPDCTVIIQAQPNHTISLYFRNFNTRNSDCTSEYLAVRDGSSRTDPLLAQLCGYQIPSPIFSNSSSMRLYSTLVSSWGGDVFDATYTTTDKGPGCGGPLFNYGGVFTSPMYPNNFRNNTVCRWDVMVPHNLQTILRFNTFDMGSSTTCETDYIEFFDVDPLTKAENFRTRYCGGDTPALFEGQTSHAIVKYTTSVHNGGTGWIIYFMGREPGVPVSDY